MQKYFCEGCKQEITIKILPDYSSSHMWCNNCGCEIYGIDLTIPRSLQLLIEYWGLLWDLSKTRELKLRDSYLEYLYTNTGECIKGELSKYYECYFDYKRGEK